MWGEKRGGIPKGSTISFRQFSTTLVNRGKKTRTGFFYLANSGMREETNKNTSTNTHLNNRIVSVSVSTKSPNLHMVNRENKTRTGLFYLANSGMREETNKNTSTNTHLNNRIN